MSSSTETSSIPWEDWPGGTILTGRYQVRECVFGGATTRVYTACDRDLDDHPVLVVHWVTQDGGALNRWMGATEATGSSMIHCEPTVDGLVAVFDLPVGSRPWNAVQGLGRSHAGALALRLGELIEATRAMADPFRVAVTGLVWLTEDGTEVATVPVHAPELDDVAQVQFLRGFVRHHVLGQRGSADEDLSSSLPEALRESLAESAELDLTALAQIVQPPESDCLVPVATEPAGPSESPSYSNRRSQSMRRTAVEGAVAAAVLLVVAIVMSPLLSTETRIPPPQYSETDRSTEEVGTAEPDVSTTPGETVDAPELFIGAHPPELYLAQGRTPEWFRHLHPIAPTPVPSGSVEPSELDTGRVAVFRDADGRVDRIERFDRAGHFAGFEQLTYDAGRVLRHEVYSSAGALLEVRTFTWTDGASGAYVRADGSGRNLESPCASRSFELDESGRYTHLRCLDDSGRPRAYAGGYHVVRWEYFDTDGLPRTRRFEDTDGNPVANSSGVVRYEWTYDADGVPVSRSATGAGDLPTRDLASGSATIRWERGQTYELESHFSVSGEPTLNRRGWHAQRTVFSDSGAMLLREFADARDESVEDRRSGAARITYTPDPNGWSAATAYYDTELNPTIDPNGVHTTRFVRDAHGHVLRECDYGRNRPIASPRLRGAHCIVYEHDVHGRVVAESFVGTDGQPTTDAVHGAERIHYALDERGRPDSVRLYSADQEATTGTARFHRIDNTHDEHGRLTGFAYFGLGGDPIEIGGAYHAARRSEWNAYDEWTRMCFFDADEQPTSLSEGFAGGASCILRTLEGPRLTALQYVGTDGEPVDAQFGDIEAARIELEVDSTGLLIRQLFFNAAGDQVDARHCGEPLTCVGDSGWSFYVSQP